MPIPTAIDAYWNFFQSFNSRDAHSFAHALNYPHIRMTWRLAPTVYADAEAYALRQNWDPLIARGWDHSEGLEPEILHESDDKVHLAGGWQRVEAEGNVILPNLVCYIVTCVDSVWGIQSRFGTDSGDRASDLHSERRDNCFLIAGRFLQAIRDDDDEKLVGICAVDYYEIGVGKLATFQKRNRGPELGRNPDLSAVHYGPHSATLAVTSDSGGALLYLTFENEWRVKATSWI